MGSWGCSTGIGKAAWRGQQASRQPPSEPRSLPGAAQHVKPWQSGVGMFADQDYPQNQPFLKRTSLPEPFSDTHKCPAAVSISWPFCIAFRAFPRAGKGTFPEGSRSCGCCLGRSCTVPTTRGVTEQPRFHPALHQNCKLQ